MKKSDLFKIGVLLMATTLGTTGCSFGEDEKKPEIVVDPAEKTIEPKIRKQSQWQSQLQ